MKHFDYDFNFRIDFYSDDCDLSEIDKDMITEAMQTALDCAGFSEDSFLSYTLVNKEEMKKMNNDYRYKDYVTDVLSFPQYDEDGFDAIEGEEVFVGDVVICPEKLKEQAEEYGHSYTREITYISVHSALHLLGYDHIYEDDKLEMRKMEKLVIKKLKEVYNDL